MYNLWSVVVDINFMLTLCVCVVCVSVFVLYATDLCPT